MSNQNFSPEVARVMGFATPKRTNTQKVLFPAATPKVMMNPTDLKDSELEVLFHHLTQFCDKTEHIADKVGFEHLVNAVREAAIANNLPSAVEKKTA